MVERMAASNTEATDARASAFWRGTLDFFLKGAPTPLMRVVRRLVPDVVYEDFVITGRRTGKPYRLLLGVYDVDGSSYVGHPNGTTAWVLNLAAAGACTVTRRNSSPVRMRAVEIPAGDERDAVIVRAGDQPAPAGAIYRGAASHIRAVGRFFRLEPFEPSATRPEAAAE
jgi:hypothetical protein